ncbi:unnamed protein product [Porites evermanni]|uniref:Green fluorescent protein n=1 Tax=Porites evermanni TaxID=104178 RepID=A0ABN8QSM4_9CNID|nr:unnamed protein product [Porites evermanni]
MTMTYHMEGSVNGHSFTIEGEGRGSRTSKGKQILTLRVTKGGPLPFSFDILSAVFCYGNRAFTDYPASIVDYFKPFLIHVDPFIQVIKDDMTMTYHMEGSVNGHSFTIEGEGRGKPYEGKQILTLRVTKGGPLPFSFDILSAVFCYGNRAFTDYPASIVDYFKP